MRGGITPTQQVTTIDVAAWTAVGLATLATTTNALMAIGTIAPAELPLTAASAAVMVVASGFAAMRHLRAVGRANEAALELALAQGNEASARDRLAFARHSAALMATLPFDEGLHAVLTESLTRFHAQAAAIVGTEVTLATAEGVDREKAEDAVRKLALDTVKSGRSLSVADAGHLAALTAPLRVRGEIRDVIVLWRHGHSFRTGDLDGLSLIARMVELSSENAALVGEVRGQLDGTLRMVIDLVEQRLPDYGAYSERVSRYAVAVGRLMGMHEDEIEDLRVTALLHDIGMLSVPEAILTTPRRLTDEEMTALRAHPVHGAALTRDANFPDRVQQAVRSHHERVDGAGYPDRLAGDAIPAASRVLSVCDAFVALISDRPHRPAVSVPEAIETLRASAGSHYDAGVVEMFVEAQAEMATEGA